MTGVAERAKNSLSTYDYAHVCGVDPGYPVQLVRDLVAEVERLQAELDGLRQSNTWESGVTP